jgi:hypothetical protein
MCKRALRLHFVFSRPFVILKLYTEADQHGRRKLSQSSADVAIAVTSDPIAKLPSDVDVVSTHVE